MKGVYCKAYKTYFLKKNESPCDAIHAGLCKPVKQDLK